MTRAIERSLEELLERHGVDADQQRLLTQDAAVDAILARVRRARKPHPSHIVSDDDLYDPETGMPT